MDTQAQKELENKPLHLQALVQNFKNMKNITLILLIIICFIRCNNSDSQTDKDKLVGSDFELFNNTPLSSLAKAVENENLSEIDKIYKTKQVDIDFQESKFGNTLLMLSVRNSKYKSTVALLNCGADPNKHNNFRGSTPMIWAAGNDDIRFLKLFLKMGGDPNSIENALIKKTKDKSRRTALNVAISLSDTKTLERVKLLVESGAHINFSQSNTFITQSPLSDAFVYKKLDVALYLLNNGADFDKPLYTMVDGHQVFILEKLRKIVVDLDSEDYKLKYQIVEYLKRNGLLYASEPIPEYIVTDIKKRNPEDWHKFLEKY